MAETKSATLWRNDSSEIFSLKYEDEYTIDCFSIAWKSIKGSNDNMHIYGVN